LQQWRPIPPAAFADTRPLLQLGRGRFSCLFNVTAGPLGGTPAAIVCIPTAAAAALCVAWPPATGVSTNALLLLVLLLLLRRRRWQHR
jgi:hypothetical protein